MNTILQATADLLKFRKFQPAFTEDGEILLVRCCGEHLFWTTAVDTSKDGTIVTLLSRVTVKAPHAKRGACAKLLARLNYGKRQGAFHLDQRIATGMNARAQRVMRFSLHSIGTELVASTFQAGVRFLGIAQFHALSFTESVAKGEAIVAS